MRNEETQAWDWAVTSKILDFSPLLSLKLWSSSTYLPWWKSLLLLSLSLFPQRACSGTCSWFPNELGLKSAGHSSSIQKLLTSQTSAPTTSHPSSLFFSSMLSVQLHSPSLLYLLFCHLLLLFLLVLLPCNSHWHTHLSAWLLLVLTSPCLGPYTSSHAIQSQDYPSVDLLANLSLIAKCPESKGAFGCSPLFPSPLSPLTNRFFSMIKQVLKVQLLHWHF